MLEFEHRPEETCGVERAGGMLRLRSIDVVLTYIKIIGPVADLYVSHAQE
jgi:hypothetical protein